MVSYAFIDPSEVAQLYHSGLEPGRDFQVVDVRDEDRIGGHLPGSMRAPSEQRTLQSVQDLVVKLEGVPKVIFHCTLSQIRGPKAASLYCTALNERPDALDFESATSNSIIENSGTPLTATSTKDSTNTRAAQNFSPNPFELKASASEQNRSQQVLVLRGGFGEWQRMYKDDPKLVEGFDPSIWAEGKDY
ncbi:hypothetical protein MVLG_01311 [Microbotryum lychnidis-dioicae p1A1 Lamole]|uniref:Rhodanese domain-containing protein n=1 Tax=Microbotryum lychnidis-dioicae (strain p1A1 Lamole / MvSl-1064) TaxID=683840 RepID=U5H1Q9_USTV1|nr:hypothetical protein MVLG_01311 [Microbotryum lychnidis-dioicae p1A1 Lamole]|eukprot:KDE08533.1 hypothetical protein MVLG_01311 [Microbotryum lychnidis-dioicae p1A1 Lamole]